MQFNYYINENGDYVETNPEYNRWKTGFNKNGYHYFKRQRKPKKKRKYFWNKLISYFESYFI